MRPRRWAVAVWAAGDLRPHVRPTAPPPIAGLAEGRHRAAARGGRPDRALHSGAPDGGGGVRRGRARRGAPAAAQPEPPEGLAPGQQAQGSRLRWPPGGGHPQWGLGTAAAAAGGRRRRPLRRAWSLRPGAVRAARAAQTGYSPAVHGADVEARRGREQHQPVRCTGGRGSVHATHPARHVPVRTKQARPRRPWARSNPLPFPTPSLPRDRAAPAASARAARSRAPARAPAPALRAARCPCTAASLSSAVSPAVSAPRARRGPG